MQVLVTFEKPRGHDQYRVINLDNEFWGAMFFAEDRQKFIVIDVAEHNNVYFDTHAEAHEYVCQTLAGDLI